MSQPQETSSEDELALSKKMKMSPERSRFHTRAALQPVVTPCQLPHKPSTVPPKGHNIGASRLEARAAERQANRSENGVTGFQPLDRFINRVVGGSGKNEPQRSSGLNSQKDLSQNLPARATRQRQTSSAAAAKVVDTYYDAPTTLPGEKAAKPEDIEQLKEQYASSEKQLLERIAGLTEDNMRQARELESQQEINTCREQEAQRLERHMDHKNKQDQRSIQNLKHTLSIRDRELERLRQANADNVRNLEKCKDQIFCLQPVEGKTDNELKDQYINMCSSIEYWVENHFGEVDDLIEALLSAEDCGRPRNIVSHFTTKADLRIVQKNPMLDLVMLQVIIWRYLDQEFLAETKMFPGLPQGVEECLNGVIRGLATLQPPKDDIAIQMWRVDLQRAFNVMDSLREEGKQYMREMETGVMSCLRGLGRGDTGGGIQESQCRRLVSETAELANNIRQSVAIYNLEPVCNPDNIPQDRVLTTGDLKGYRVIDSRTGAALTSSATPVAGPNGRVGELLFDVFPGFVRKSSNVSERIVLVKPTVVVKFDHEVPRERKNKVSRGNGNVQ